MKKEKVVSIPCLVLWALLILPGDSHSFKPADLEKLLRTKACQWCDLGDANLTGAKLSGADMSGANLSGAVLVGADLSKADLSNAYIHNANLSDADLTDAFLNDANLKGANVNGANLTDAELSGVTWTNGKKCDRGSAGKCNIIDLLGWYE